jgi:hypothetical protein
MYGAVPANLAVVHETGNYCRCVPCLTRRGDMTTVHAAEDSNTAQPLLKTQMSCVVGRLRRRKPMHMTSGTHSTAQAGEWALAGCHSSVEVGRVGSGVCGASAGRRLSLHARTIHRAGPRTVAEPRDVQQ